MGTSYKDQCCIDIDHLCSAVKAYIKGEDYESGIDLLYQNMACFPHAPQPHNLLAIIFEKTGKHHEATKHFQAALALDPDYLPAKYNLERSGNCFSGDDYAYDESDVTLGESGNIEIVYDSRNIGHAVYKNKIEYDEHRIGHILRK